MGYSNRSILNIEPYRSIQPDRAQNYSHYSIMGSFGRQNTSVRLSCRQFAIYVHIGSIKSGRYIRYIRETGGPSGPSGINIGRNDKTRQNKSEQDSYEHRRAKCTTVLTRDAQSVPPALFCFKGLPVGDIPF